MAIVCAPAHRLARARRLSPGVLDGETWVTFPVRHGTGDAYARLLSDRLAACGLGEPEMIAIESLTAQKRLVEAGFGLGLVPESSIDEELRLGTLRVLRIAAMRIALPVVLVHRRGAYLRGATRALMALLAERR